MDSPAEIPGSEHTTAPAGAMPSWLELPAAVRALDLAIDRFRSAFAARFGVSLNDALVLSGLANAGGRLSPRELSGRLDVSSSSLTMILDRLEAAGLVSRIPNPADRRSLFVELSPAGASLLVDECGARAGDYGSLAPAVAALVRRVDHVTDRLTEPDEAPQS